MISLLLFRITTAPSVRSECNPAIDPALHATWISIGLYFLIASVQHPAAHGGPMSVLLLSVIKLISQDAPFDGGNVGLGKSAALMVLTLRPTLACALTCRVCRTRNGKATERIAWALLTRCTVVCE